MKEIEGTIEADTEAAAINRLGSQGIFPTSIVEAGGSNTPSNVWSSGRISTRTLAYMTRQLADLLGGGIPLMGALTLLTKQTEQRALHRVVDSLAGAVRDGQSLSQALSRHSKVFPPLYISMVRAGEVGGGLEQALVRLADLGEHEAELKSRVLSASAYPVFVLFVAIGMTAFLMMYVIPKLSLVFLESGQLLPLPTRILLTISQIMTRWWWIVVGVLIALGMGVRQWYATPSGKAMMDRVLMAIPGLGMLTRKLETARVTRNLGIMVSQGVPILQALDVVSQNVSNTVLRRAVGGVEAAVRDGSSIAGALAASGEFPAFVSNMVAIGEESGTLDAALMKVSLAYEREVDRTMRTLTTVLEPVLLVLVGGVVMFIVLAMLLPVFQIGLVVQ